MIEILNFRPADPNDKSLIGRFDIKIPAWNGMIIRNMAYLRKDKARWVSFPTHKLYTNNEPKYAADIEFDELEEFRQILRQIREALDIYLLNS